MSRTQYVYVWKIMFGDLYIYIYREWMWSRALDVRLSEWCCSVSMVWVQIPSEGRKKN